MIDGLSVLALIPARGGSKGIPGKNIAPLAGRPLIHWTIAAARNSKFIDRVILSSDDEAISAAARAAGCDVPFVRAAELATDEASSMDVVLDALARTPGYDIVVLLQPTSPLRVAEDIDGCLVEMLRSDAPCCVSVQAAANHPYLTYRLDDQASLMAYASPPVGQNLRRQDLPAAWCLNGAVYAARTPWLQAQRNFLSSETRGYPMPTDRSIDIDTPADLASAAAILQAKHSPAH